MRTLYYHGFCFFNGSCALRVLLSFIRRQRKRCIRDGHTGVELEQVQPAHIRRWMAGMHASGRSGRGIALILSGWRGFYTWLAREGRVPAHPGQGIRAPPPAQPSPPPPPPPDRPPTAADEPRKKRGMALSNDEGQEAKQLLNKRALQAGRSRSGKGKMGEGVLGTQHVM